MTTYIAADRQSDRDYPVYLIEGDYPGLGVNETPTGWYWTGDRRKATRFQGRESAEVFARKVETWIRWNGKGTVRLSVLPATGGVEITRKSAKEQLCQNTLTT